MSKVSTVTISIILVTSVLVTSSGISYASRIDTLKAQIQNRNNEIEKLEKEIEEYQLQLEEIGKEAKTLENAIWTYALSIKKFNTDIRLTEKKIDNTKAEIEQLNDGITEKEKNIKRNIEAISETIKKINEMESQTLIEVILSYNNLSAFWDEVETLQRFQDNVKQNLDALRVLKQKLLENKNLAEEKQQELKWLKNDLSDKKRIVLQNKREKDALLALTKNKESNYKKILEEKLAQKEAFEKEIYELESALRLEIDPESIPTPRSGILAWPLNKIKITQYFGNTNFAKTHPQVYKGKGHNGVDFRASLGTPIKAALSGTVEGIGNTDEIKGCYSYGKWILLRHNNGLSTLYAHLSLIKVQPGQEVGTGDIIGYSGNTGYSTGPHLHFTVYATQGVKITKFDKSINCKDAVIPIADLRAYLNPLSYL
jgi:murein DD-endopeptidase MepM/ murein hydrolase activator NlpD